MCLKHFFGDLIGIMILVNQRHKLSLRHWLIGISSIAYSLIYESFFGEYLNLYHYIDTEHSVLYIIISGILIYPPMNILYTVFLPTVRYRILVYTGGWVVGVLFFEYLSIMTKTVVFTGWQPIPWSIITYIVTCIWIFYFNRVLAKKIN